LPLMWLPWVLWPRLWGTAGCVRRPDAGMRFCLAVLLPALLVFSLISGKQGKYLLPLFPLLALLMARWLAELPRDNTAYRPHFAGVLLIAGGLALLVARGWPDGPAWLAQIQLLWGLALLLWGGVLLVMKLTLTGVVRSAALGTVLCSLVMYLALAELVRAPFDLKRTSLTLAELQQSGRQLAYLGKYHGQFQFSGRLGERIEPLDSRGQLQDWLQAHPDGFLLVNYKAPPQELPELLLIQSYRGGSLVLWPAAQLREQPRWLDALPGSG